MKVSTVFEMREMDRAAIEQYQIPETLLMENAGRAAFSVLDRVVPVRERRILVVCGGGNNGGDGLVVARHVLSAGGDVCVLLLSDPRGYGAASRINYEAALALGIQFVRISDGNEAAEWISWADAVVDALLGTGIGRNVQGLYEQVIAQINASGVEVLSIDIPSGVNGDTGQEMGMAIEADWTVTFGLPKVGNLLLPGWERGGELYVSHISFPPVLYGADDILVEVNNPVPPPPRNIGGHKGTFGQALFIAGAANYFGAPYLAAMSYLKAGGGYSRLAAPAGIVSTLAAQGSEIVFVPQVETESGSIGMDNVEALVELADQMSFVVIGPGLSLDDESQDLVRQLVARVERPILIDGDGITAVQSGMDSVRSRSQPTVLTPHLGEMSRLSGMGVDELEADRVSALRSLTDDLQATVVLKGAHTLIGEHNGRVFVNLTGNSGMATAGSGDVLTGAIAAMFGLGLPFDAAVRTGVFVHGLAGDLASERMGEDGMTASDVMASLPAAVRTLRQGLATPELRRYLGPEVV